MKCLLIFFETLSTKQFENKLYHFSLTGEFVISMTEKEGKAMLKHYLYNTYII